MQRVISMLFHDSSLLHLFNLLSPPYMEAINVSEHLHFFIHRRRGIDLCCQTIMLIFSLSLLLHKTMQKHYLKIVANSESFPVYIKLSYFFHTLHLIYYCKQFISVQQ